MSENFRLVKKKYLIAAIVAAVALGVCCGVGLTCALAVVLKRCAVDLFWAIYIPVALVLAAGFFGLFYVLFKPTDHKIAKKLDRDYELGQKVQTMVEYRGESGAMVLLQREQTDEALGEVAKKRVDLKWLLKFLFIPVLAVAMLFAGIFVPAVKSSDDPVYNITSGQQTSLKNLIRDVESSNLDEGIKVPTVEILNDLLKGLQNEQPQSVMRRAVITSVRTIDALIASANSYITVNVAFSAAPELKGLADSIVRGTLYYSGGRSLNTFSAVNENALVADQSIKAETDAWSVKFLKDYKDEEGESVTYLPVANAAEKLGEYADKLAAQLATTPYAKSEEAPKDALYSALDTLATSFKTLSLNTAGVGVKPYYDSISGFCTVFGESATTALITQSYRCMMDEHIRLRLANIFNMSAANDFGKSVAIAEEIPDGGGDDGDKELNPGETNGEIIYGSDDLVLDAATGKQVKYIDLLTKFFNSVEEMIARGECSEEAAVYIKQYYEMLYLPSKE
ncbi:MAG: hypothetical protein K2K39_00640 [Clostridia bacterium]|nr:hypothetical protein [Clostridia bacterium]